MPRYYCDYCDTYLTHDSPSVRKQHNAGYKHKANVRTYYQQFEEQQTQSLIDQRIKEHLGQAQAFGPLGVGAAYNQHLMGQRPRLPLMPAPMPIPGTGQLPGNVQYPMRPPPMLPRPFPGYGSGPGMLPIPGPPGAPTYPGPGNGVLRPPPTTMPGNMAPVPSSGAPTYQMNSAPPPPPPNGGFDSFNANVPAPESNH